MHRFVHINLYATGIERIHEENLKIVGVRWENRPLEYLEDELINSFVEFLKTRNRDCLLEIGEVCAALNWRIGFDKSKNESARGITANSPADEEDSSVMHDSKN